MEPTIKRVIRQNSTCEDAKGDYCYCQCLGVFHGINHQPIRERQLSQKEKKLPLDVCTCKYPDKQNVIWLHQKTDRFFRVCKNCGGRVFILDAEGIIASWVGKGIKV